MSRLQPLFLLAFLLALGACSEVEPPPATDGTAESEAPFQASPVTVASWGPQATTPGVAANPQPDGSTGMYFMLSRPVDGVQVEVLVDGQPLEGVVVDGETVTAQLPASRFAENGVHPVALRLASGETIEVGDFLVADSVEIPGEAAQPAPQ